MGFLFMMIEFTTAVIRFPEYLWNDVNSEILTRLAFSAAAGTLIGIERERHGRAAGLRTQLLVCLAACIAMILSDRFYQRSLDLQNTSDGWHPDPARLAAGVLAGMGFLGAGVILRQSTHVIRGVTTAATLWFVSMIGMAFGAGSIGIGIVATLGSCLILIAFPHLETRIKKDWYSDLSVTFDPLECSIASIVKVLDPLALKVKGIDTDDSIDMQRCSATFHLKYKRQEPIEFSETVRDAVRGLPGIHRIEFRS
jgi:putative Mg2+ transporter-C (MgtC) family protein